MPAAVGGCPGTGNVVPEISSSGAPTVASTSFAVDLSSARPNAVAPLAVGLSNTSMGSVPLPVPIGGGCQLSQSMNVLILLVTSNGGSAQLPLPIPNDQTLKGAKVYFQFAANDPGNPLGFTTTAGMRVTVL